MSLLRDIQSNAVKEDGSVSELLRQCMVLSARLHNEQLREWVELEQGGYPADTPRPSYRPHIVTTVLGHLNGPFGSEVRNVPLPMMNVRGDNEALRDLLFYFDVRHRVSEIERLVASGEDNLRVPWPADAVAFVQHAFNPNMVLVEAHQVVPVTVFTSVLSGIRDRVLTFALAIEAENPDAGEAPPSETPIPESRVTQIVSQNFFGDFTTVANAGRDAVQTVDASAIEAVLRGLGIVGADADELIAAVAEDGPSGPRARSWFAMLQRGAVQLGSGVSIATAATVIGKLLGLG